MRFAVFIFTDVFVSIGISVSTLSIYLLVIFINYEKATKDISVIERYSYQIYDIVRRLENFKEADWDNDLDKLKAWV